MRVRIVLLLAALWAVAIALAAAARSAQSPARFLQTSGIVSGIAADGGLVAVNVAATKSDCDHVLVWDVATRSVVRLAGRKKPCIALSTGQSITSLGIAGRRVVWVRDGGGNQHEQEALTATFGFPRRVAQLAFATYETDTGFGDHVGNVHGDGSLLVYNTWSVCAGPEAEGAFRPCPAGAEPGVYSEQIWRVRGTAKTRIASAPGRLDVLAVGSGRIAALRGDGSVEVRSETGRVLRRFQFAPRAVEAAALSPAKLVVQAEDRVDVYGVSSGRLVDEWDAPRGLRLQDADTRYAAFAGGRSLVVLRLSDGKAVPVGVGSAPVSAQLEPEGLYFGYASPSAKLKGRVGYLPWSALAAKFR